MRKFAKGYNAKIAVVLLGIVFLLNNTFLHANPTLRPILSNDKSRKGDFSEKFKNLSSNKKIEFSKGGPQIPESSIGIEIYKGTISIEDKTKFLKSSFLKKELLKNAKIEPDLQRIFFTALLQRLITRAWESSSKKDVGLRIAYYPEDPSDNDKGGIMKAEIVQASSSNDVWLSLNTHAEKFAELKNKSVSSAIEYMSQLFPLAARLMQDVDVHLVYSRSTKERHPVTIGLTVAIHELGIRETSKMLETVKEIFDLPSVKVTVDSKKGIVFNVLDKESSAYKDRDKVNVLLNSIYTDIGEAEKKIIQQADSDAANIHIDLAGTNFDTLTSIIGDLVRIDSLYEAIKKMELDIELLQGYGTEDTIASNEKINFSKGSIDISNLGEPIEIFANKKLEHWKKLFEIIKKGKYITYFKSKTMAGEKIENLGLPKFALFDYIFGEFVENAFQYSNYSGAVEVEVLFYPKDRRDLTQGGVVEIGTKQPSSLDGAREGLRVNKEGFDSGRLDYLMDAKKRKKLKAARRQGMFLVLIGALMKKTKVDLVYDIENEEPFSIEARLYIELLHDIILDDIEKEPTKIEQWLGKQFDRILLMCL